ncbi:hypothetical protein D030_5039B, partial [Vibrio parahaemolyticus AQ3810]|jgi:hypothetical protein
VKS